MAERTTPERRAAHERLATGAFARWTRACATHPWRVVLSWVGIIAVLIALVATVGGSLKDEFEIPGSDTQKATDLIEAEFAEEQGGVLNLVFAAPSRRAARHRRAPRGDRGRRRRAGDGRVRAERGRSRHHRGGRPLRREHVLGRRPDRVRRGAVRPGHLRHRSRGGPRRPGRRARGGRAGGRHRRVQRRRRVPAGRAGDVRAAGPARRDPRAADRLPHVRGDVHPDRARDRRPDDGVPAPVHPRRAHRHQHDHADPRLDDRTRRRDRLLTLHRHALPAAAARRALAARRRRRGGRVRRPGGAVRGSDRGDLGRRPRLLRARLRDQARNRQLTRRPDHGPDRELAADRRPAAARSQDRPPQGPVPAAARRLGGRPRQDAHRTLGTIRDGERKDRVSRRAARPDRARVDVVARPSRRRRPGDAAHRSDEPEGLRPARGRVRAGLQRADPDRRRRQWRRGRAGTALRRHRGPGRRRVRRRAATSTTRRPLRSSSSHPLPRHRTRRRTSSSNVFAARSCRLPSRAAMRSPTSRDKPPHSRTSATGSWSGCRCSCSS